MKVRVWQKVLFIIFVGPILIGWIVLKAVKKIQEWWRFYFPKEPY